ncbi:putative membrane protein [Paraburkholderia bannensis]|uniref:Putative membrane protein n=1 Tax=Paraburkholderia bannensis TaxID=765414 RepID=A0A7W9U3E2_9BURK|nr:putative membrane protein [Paraburkholderia sp. WP4_3_2]MBB6106283.1 putative membrane protein [Paraburkholderia bannensis]
MSGGPPDITGARREADGEQAARTSSTPDGRLDADHHANKTQQTQPRTLPSSQNSRHERDLAATALTPREGRRFAALGAFILLAALTALCLAWEWRIAPLRPGGSALVLKALPLAAALPGVLRRRLYTFQWASMLVLLYFAEGIVRGMTDPAPGDVLGWIEVGLSFAFFGCALAYVAPFKRAARRAKREAA